MWQALYDELKDHNFTVIAVALDSTLEPATSIINEAAPAYTALIDREHRTADLYGMVNVPTAVWIDEEGRIVRPAEPAGTYESFRKMNLETFAVPEDEAEKARVTRQVYLDAIRDWVAKGPESEFAYNEDDARDHLPPLDDNVAEAHTRFRLGQHLVNEGREAEGRTFLERAIELHPDSWAIWRQAAPKDPNGFAGLEDFWQRVHALGERRYYPQIEMRGIPE